MTLSVEEIDLLKEVSNIGGGHAASALSRLSEHKVLMTVPQIQVVSAGDALIIDRQDSATVVHLNLFGDFQAELFILFHSPNLLELLTSFLKRAGQPLKDVEIASSAVIEAATIMVAAFADALASLFDAACRLRSPEFGFNQSSHLSHARQTLYLVSLSFINRIDARMVLLMSKQGTRALLSAARRKYS